MKTLRILIACLLMAIPVSLPLVVTGCKNTTKEAVVYYTIKDSYTLTHEAYKSWNELVVQKKVSKQAEAEVDAAWNNYRGAYAIAVLAARTSTSPAGTNLVTIQTETISLIRKLSK